MSRGFALLERAIRELARSRDLPARLASERLEPSSLLEELGLDSVGTIALLLEVEVHLGRKIPESHLKGLRTLGELADLVDRVADGSAS